MPIPQKPIPPEVIAEAKRLYLRTDVPVADICFLLGIGSYTFYQRVKQWGWPKRMQRIPKDEPERAKHIDAESDDPAASPELILAAARAAARSFETPAAGDVASISVRLQRAIERGLAGVDQLIAKLNSDSANGADADRIARAMASLARTLQVLKTLNRAEGEESTATDEHDAIPRDIDSLRRELSARLERIVAGGEGAVLRDAEDRERD